jgi:hypothetical protein
VFPAIWWQGLHSRHENSLDYAQIIPEMKRSPSSLF